MRRSWIPIFLGIILIGLSAAEVLRADDETEALYREGPIA